MNILNSLSIDLGNRFLKYCSPAQKPQIMLSVFAEVPIDSQPNLDPATSTDIHYLDGKSHCQGKRWIVGESAQEIDGYLKTMSLKNKADEALRLVLGTIALPSEPRGNEITINQLYVSVLDLQRDKPLVIEALQGSHHILRNGREMLITFNQIVVRAEAVGGYNYAIQKKVLPKGCMNGILDIGGGTVIGALFNKHGQEIPNARAVFRKSGAFDLANRIAAAPEMHTIARGSAALDKILAGIARGDYLYGATEASFKSIFDRCHPLWLKGIVNEATSRWDRHLDDIKSIAIIGGSAPLAAPLVKADNPWFKLCPEPQFANVLGLAAASSELMVKGAKS